MGECKTSKQRMEIPGEWETREKAEFGSGSAEGPSDLGRTVWYS